MNNRDQGGWARAMALTLLLLGTPTLAAEGVNLAWDHCFGQGTGVQNATFACDANVGSRVMTGSFLLGANLNRVIGLEIVLDLAAATATVPPWWDLYTTGSCRRTSLSGNLIPDPADPVCVDWSEGFAAGGLAAYCRYPGPCFDGPPTSPNRTRVVLGTAVASARARDLTPGTEYFAFHLRIDYANTVGAAGCGGCDVPVCIGLTSINVVPAGTTGSRKLTTGSAPGSNFITWQGGGVPAARSNPGCPGATATATRRSSWGTVKSLYR